MKQTLFTLCLLATVSLNAQLLSPNVDSIPMRDGKKLAADVYLPSGSTAKPTILIQTPYNRLLYRFKLPLGIDTAISTSNYNFVVVDWRCFYGSKGACVSQGNRGEDGYDVIEWIKNQPWSDGKIGTWGPSALGKIQYQTAKEHHPNHTCMVPLVAAPQFYYNEYYNGGVLRLEYVKQLDALGFGLSPFIIPYPVKNTYWNFVEPPSYFPDSIYIPDLMIGGWYDHTIEEMLYFFNGLQTISPLSARSEHRLLVGPWVHGGTGVAQVGTAQQGELSYPGAAGWSDSLAMVFFDYHLRGVNNGWNSTPKVQYFQMGDDVWQNDVAWPPSGTTPVKFYLQSYYGKYGLMDPNATTWTEDSMTFTYDPKDPSPTWGGPTLTPSMAQGPYDISDTIESRNDILIYDYTCFQDITLKGKPKLKLWVSSDRFDTDIAIRLTDVYPDGRSMIVSDGIRRLRYRAGFTPADTSRIVPGQVYPVEVALRNLALTFKQGHKLRIDITGSNYPRFNRNDNTGWAIHPGNNGDTLVNPMVSHNAIYHMQAYPSYLELPLTSPPSAVTEHHSQTDITIYPNPTSGSTNLVIKQKVSQANTVLIYDALGKQVKQFKLKAGNNTIKITRLDAGNYLVKVVPASGVTVTRKLSVVK